MAQKTLKKLALIVAASALCAGLSSCQKDADEKGGFTTGGDGTITFGVAFGNPSQDLTVKGSFELKDDAGNAIAMMEEATFDTPSPEQTKATLVNDLTGFGTSFQVSGFQGTAAYQGISNVTVTRQSAKYPDGTHEQWTLSSPKSWPSGASTALEFFAWAPADAWAAAPTFHPGVTSSNVEFTYTISDASTQKDIMLAHYKGNGKDNTFGASSASVAGVATMNFSHALSSIKFKAAEDVTGFKINSIRLEGIAKTATCAATFTKTSGTGDPYAETASYNWGDPSATANFTKEFSTAIEPSALETALEPFIVIPQTFGEDSDARIVLNITKGCSTFDITYKLADATASPARTTTWNAGETTVYKIMYNGLDIEIDDEVKDDVKSNLEIKNVGGKPAYIRVLVTGAWVNTEGDIVALWDPADAAMGSFSPAIFASDDYLSADWKRMDGFFYYKHVLPAGETIPEGKRLFNTYTADPSGKPATIKLSDHLEIDIVSQAVLADEKKASITSAWGEAAKDYVEALN